MLKIEQIIQKRDCFKEITWRHLANCLRSFEEKEYLSAAIWSAVFTESVLKDFLREFGDKSKERDELYPMIRRMANYVNNDLNMSEYDKNYIQDILRRAEEICSKRNRLVHDTGVENHGLEADVGDMYNNVMQIITRYLETDFSKKVMLSNHHSKFEEKKEESDFSVFISTITPHTFEQTEFIEGFCGRLREIGINPVRCLLNDFDKRDPMNKVRRIIQECDAFVVIGLERSHTYYYRDREGSERQSEAMHRRYTSAWLQIESGMAVGMGKEVFVLCQKDLYSDGIFDRDWNSYVPLELSMPLNIYDKSVNMVLDRLLECKEQMKIER